MLTAAETDSLFGSPTGPAPDELEFTLIGPGFGESAVVHLGGNEWIVVDSCCRGGINLPLAYLNQIKVDPCQVSRVIATHWDLDHVQGLADLFKACGNARLVVPGAFGIHSILKHLDKGAAEALRGLQKKSKRKSKKPAPEKRQPFRKANVEYGEAIALARTRTLERSDPRGYWLPAHAISVIRADQRPDWGNLLVETLSPSAQTVLNNVDALAEVVRDVTVPNELSLPIVREGRCNLLSIVVWVRVGNRTMLLGADLESPHWSSVVALDDRDGGQRGRAQAVKVPHHGSPNANDDDLWDHLTDAPSALVAPWRLAGRWLPADEHLERLATRADVVWCTCQPKPPGNTPPKKTSDPTVGFVTLRASALGTENWRVERRAKCAFPVPGLTASD